MKRFRFFARLSLGVGRPMVALICDRVSRATVGALVLFAVKILTDQHEIEPGDDNPIL